MADKANNLQDIFLNTLRKSKTPVTMFLVKGVKLQGIITWFDNFSVLLRRDGFNEAYYGRPEMLLEPEARRVCSGWSFVDPDAVARFERDLRTDLVRGAWDRRFGHFRRQSFFEGPLRLIISRP